MLNWFLIVVAIVVSGISIVVSWRLLHTFLDKDEEKRLTQDGECRLWPPKCWGSNKISCTLQGVLANVLKWVAVASLCFASWVSLLLPFDVANRRDPTVRDSVGGGLDVALMWEMTLWGVCIMTVVVLPFCFWLYEAWDPNAGADGPTAKRNVAEEEEAGGCWDFCKQCCSGSCWTLMSIFVFFGLVLILYFGVGGNAEMGYAALTCPGHDIRLASCVAGAACSPDFTAEELVEFQSGCTGSDEVLSIQVSFFVYTVALLTAIGWCLFVVFAGVGLFMLPIDMYHGWWENRLKSYQAGQVVEERKKVVARCDLLDLRLKAWESEIRERRKKISQRKITAMTYLADRLQVKHNRNESYRQDSVVSWMSSPFVIWGRALLFMFCTVWSLLWFLHMIIYTTLRYHPMLNDAFTKLDEAFALLGIMFYASFSFYLLWATVNGCTRVGLAILCIRIHPLVAGETLLSSFLFNCILILYASTACVSYCALSFREYAKNTVVDTLYGSYINKVQGFRYIMEYFQYGLFAISGLAMLYWCCGCVRAPKQEDPTADSPTSEKHLKQLN